MDNKVIEVSENGSAELSIKAGKLRIGYTQKLPKVDGEAAGYVEIGTDAVIDIITKTIPGTFDDKLGELAKAGLKAI